MGYVRYRVGHSAVVVLLVSALASPMHSFAAGLGPRAKAQGSVIKCPFLPKDLTSIPQCAGKDATCVGTDQHDLMWGSDGDDVIYTGAGNDVIQADAGDDVVCGGEGNDAIHGAKGDDTLFGEEGSDWLFGAPGADTLDGGAGDFDILWGGPGFDKLDGGAGEHDVCLLQREMGTANEATCELIYPPLGYIHDETGELGPGLLKRGW